jgi:hypothetical protein
LATKKNASNQMNSFTQKNPYRNFRTDARYFLFEARKETHEQCKTKIDIDEFRSGTTIITLPSKGGLSAPKGVQSPPFWMEKGAPAKIFIPKCTNRDFLWYRYKFA